MIDLEVGDDLFSTFVLILAMGNYAKVYGDDADPKKLAAIINLIPESDLRVAAVEWLSRRNISVLPHLNLTDLEKQALSNVIPQIAVLLT